MTLDEIRKRVHDISGIADDNEAAHTKEDALREEFIAHVAATASGDLAEMAREVLKSGDIHFYRGRT